MEYCGPRALPHSTFLNWDPLDQDKALAWVLRERQKCPGCSTNPADWKAEDGKAAIPPPWEWDLTTCYGCRERERLARTVPDDMRGVYTILMPVDLTEYDESLWNCASS